MTQEEKNQQVVPPAAEQKQPTYPQFNSAADIDARFMQMMERDAERDRAEQQRRLQRQQFAQSMGDLGNVLIDTIKMSGGALVTPRDVSARYQQMDAQSQKIYDTYRARMDLLRKYQLEKAAAEKARKQHLDDVAAQQAFAREQQQGAQAFQSEQNRLNREAHATEHEATLRNQKAIADAHNQTQKDIANQRQDAKNLRTITIGGNSLPYNKTDEKLVYGAMLYWLTQKGKVGRDRYEPEDEITGIRKPAKMSDVVSLVATNLPSLTPNEQAELYAFTDNYMAKNGQALINIEDDVDPFDGMFSAPK